jgi:peptidoglycan/LPS O-acetylase OafA/YrhL
MNAPVSIYLNLLRLMAATTVLVGHASQWQFSGGLFWQTQRYGQDAVAVFFVLSGFVIAHVTHRRETDAATYALHRAARIYSVAVPALLLTFVLDSATCHFGPGSLSASECNDYYDRAATSFPLGLTFLGEVWNVNLTPGTNVPYWSLGFEVPYYLVFGVLCFAPRPWNRFAAALLLIAFGPKISTMFGIWLIGFVCYRLCVRTYAGRTRAGIALWLASTAMLGVVAGSADSLLISAPFAPTAAQMQAYLHYVLLGLLVAGSILGLHMASGALAPLAARAGRPIGWLAGATFSIYLFHMPLLHFVAALSPWPLASWPNRALVFVGVPATILVLAAATERRKELWRDGLLALAERLRLAPRG